MAARKPRMRLAHELRPGRAAAGLGQGLGTGVCQPVSECCPDSSETWTHRHPGSRRRGRFNDHHFRQRSGHPAEILPRLFRMRVSTKAKSGTRSGLGLQIVAAIVKEYGGRITAANRERGTGAVFTITLPAA